ncbi:MAG: hypothetical protein MJE68_20630 [Proteobacteria bacterium]|nr:hypothetical protein [Pseudomonadota bacterium]
MVDGAQTGCGIVRQDKGKPKDKEGVHSKVDKSCFIEVLRDFPCPKSKVNGYDEKEKIVTKGYQLPNDGGFTTYQLNTRSARHIDSTWPLNGKPNYRYNSLNTYKYGGEKELA